MDQIQAFLQVSAKLFQHLTTVAENEKRDDYIKKIHSLLDEREVLIEQIQRGGFQFDEINQSHIMLRELDKGIKERLQIVFNVVKSDLKILQIAKKNEKQYMNPYANIAVMDGRYYDKKN